MKLSNKRVKMAVFAILGLALFGLALTGGQRTMADTALYRAALASNKNRIVAVTKKGDALAVRLEGFGAQPIELKANGGGTSACRTIVEHNSNEATVILSLAIPDPRSRCRPLPSFVSIESRAHGITLDEESIKKIAGSNPGLRAAVRNILGSIDEEEG